MYFIPTTKKGEFGHVLLYFINRYNKNYFLFVWKIEREIESHNKRNKTILIKHAKERISTIIYPSVFDGDINRTYRLSKYENYSNDTEEFKC